MRYLTSIILVVSVVALGFIGLTYYVNIVHGQTSGLITSSDTSGMPASNGNGAQLLVLLNRLKGITLDGRIFSSEAFKNLEDRTVTIVPQPVGRNNPYLPTTAGKVIKNTTTKTSSSKSPTTQFIVR